ncbi:hypothetical protein GOP47_0023202 [Adiantum capillus-veneris]|uniref:Uncharacterized protein n=1 Tax=Adiantum capillus-veneris TaxID=13818 RepID=A0A9D4Z505_ADICA|nr:hypothetical protein GOP47_0023202 [Adiantum capillus-veneris]
MELPEGLLENVLLLTLEEDLEPYASMPFSVLLPFWEALPALNSSIAFQLCRSLHAPSLRASDWILSFAPKSPPRVLDTTCHRPCLLGTPQFLTRGAHTEAPLVTHIAASASLACFRIDSGDIFVVNPLSTRWRPWCLPQLPPPSDDDDIMQTSSSDDYNVKSYNSSSSNSYEDEMSMISGSEFADADVEDVAHEKDVQSTAISDSSTTGVASNWPLSDGFAHRQHSLSRSTTRECSPSSYIEEISVVGLHSDFYGNPVRRPHFKVVVVRLNAKRTKATETLEYDSLSKCWKTTGRPLVHLTMKVSKGVCCKEDIFFLDDRLKYSVVPVVCAYNTRCGMWRGFQAPLPIQMQELNVRQNAILTNSFRQALCNEDQYSLAHFTYASLVECQGELFFVGAFQWKSFDSSSVAVPFYLRSQDYRVKAQGEEGIKLWKLTTRTSNFSNADQWAMIWKTSDLVEREANDFSSLHVELEGDLGDSFDELDRDNVAKESDLGDFFDKLDRGNVDCTGIGNEIYFVDSKLSKVYVFQTKTQFWEVIEKLPLKDSLLRHHQQADQDDRNYCALRSRLPYQCFAISPGF